MVVGISSGNTVYQMDILTYNITITDSVRLVAVYKSSNTESPFQNQFSSSFYDYFLLINQKKTEKTMENMWIDWKLLIYKGRFWLRKIYLRFILGDESFCRLSKIHKLHRWQYNICSINWKRTEFADCTIGSWFTQSPVPLHFNVISTVANNWSTLILQFNV